jgi:hypothetical protein
MMQVLRGITVTAETSKILHILRANRELHGQIVKEAREGYMEKAKKALEHRLAQLKEGKLKSLQFSLHPPQDYTNVYDSAIQMLLMHVPETIELDANVSRCLIENQWDWSQSFLVGNARYSKTAFEEVSKLGSEFVEAAMAAEDGSAG